MSIVLILGSGPNVVAARDWPRDRLGRIVAINNAWAVRPDWDLHIHPEDFPPEARPSPGPDQRIVTYQDYVPAMNAHGGVVWCGGTMAFTAGYWALQALRPRVIAFLGCDMVYAASGNTHFYGTGTADPLRADVTLQSLEAKAARLFLTGALRGTLCVNLSAGESRLVFPRARPEALGACREGVVRPDLTAVAAALRAERQLGYAAPDGKYWKIADRLDGAALAHVDTLWTRAFAASRVDLAPREAMIA